MAKEETKEAEEEFQPQTAAEFVRRGWQNHSRKLYAEAEEDFRKALSLDHDLIDAWYGLGMTLKARRQREGARDSFQQVIRRLEEPQGDDRVRAKMLRRLATAQLDLLTRLEGEVSR